jgi:hypothetical protein
MAEKTEIILKKPEKAQTFLMKLIKVLTYGLILDFSRGLFYALN